MEHTKQENQSNQYTNGNILIKHMTGNKKPNGFIQFELMNHLTPNEFYVYTYLLNAPSDFNPSYDKFSTLLGYKSKTTIMKVVNKLRTLRLLTIDQLDDIWVWTVSFQAKLDEIDKVEVFEDLTSYEDINRDKNKIKRDIQIKREMLDTASDEDVLRLLEEIVQMEGELSK